MKGNGIERDTLGGVIDDLKKLDKKWLNGKNQMSYATLRDALYYLKMYKELADDSEAFAEWKENQPLTLEELKTMKGKPVWIEQDGFTPQWELVTRIGKVHFYAVDAVFFETEYDIERYGKTWKAYRKER